MKAVWFTDGWARSYQARAKSYGHVMPDDEQRRMKRALFRMYRSQEREDAQRAEVGKKKIWA